MPSVSEVPVLMKGWFARGREISPGGGVRSRLGHESRGHLPGALLAAVPVTLIVFDALRPGRDHLERSPYVLRRALLDDLGLQVPGTVQVPPAFSGDAWAPLTFTSQDPPSSTTRSPRPAAPTTASAACSSTWPP
jgi:hypothetical protein